MRDIRCPHCNQKMGDSLDGRYESRCRRCKRWVIIERRDNIDIELKAV